MPDESVALVKDAGEAAVVACALAGDVRAEAEKEVIN